MLSLAYWRNLSDPDRRLLSRSPLFDVGWYRSQCPDAPADKAMAVAHYLETGAADGFDPHPLFNTSWYQQEYAEVLGDRNPLIDYLRQGAFTGRDPNPWFDSAWYLASNRDLSARGIDPLTDYVTTGWRASRNPHPNFDARWYLAKNEDVARAGYEPLGHFLLSGEAEGRKPCPPERWTVLHRQPGPASANPRLIQPAFNFAAGGLSRRVVAIHGDETHAGMHAAAVMDRILASAAKHPYERIVDIGPDLPAPSATALSAATSEVWQVHWGERLAAGINVRTMKAHVEDATDLDRMTALFDDKTTLFVLRHTLETLQDPRLLLRMLRRALRRHPDNQLLLATIERNAASADDDGAPRSARNVRLWTGEELSRFITGSGFEIVTQYTVTTSSAPGVVSQLMELRCNQASYAAFLARNRLPAAAAHLVLTTGHVHAPHTSGIDDQLSKNAIRPPRLTLFCGVIGLPRLWLDFVRERDWLHLADLRGLGWRKRNDVLSVSTDEVLDAVLQALFIYDEIALIEYQDFFGIGARVAQAKRAGLLPPSVMVVAYAYGTHFSMDQAEGSLPRPDDLIVGLSERISLEQADCVVFPSAFQRRLTVETQGLRLRGERLQPYPFRFAPVTASGDPKASLDTLIFHGQRSVRTGYEDFCVALQWLWAQPEHQVVRERIKTVIMLGVGTPEPRLAALKGLIVEYGERTDAEATALLRRHAAQALVVLPYRGQNQPLALFEAAESGADWLSYRDGAIPEWIPHDLSGEMLCDPGAQSLAAAIARTLARSTEQCRELRTRMQAHLVSAAAAATAGYDAMAAEFVSRRDPPPPRALSGKATVIVANLNGPSRFFDDLRFGLANSFAAPAATVIIDDGSVPDNLAIAESAAAAIPNARLHTVSHRGLAGARNAGLEFAQTPYVCAHDNDNIISNHFLRIAMDILDRNPEIAAVTSWHNSFRDGSRWEFRDYPVGFYHPPGQDLGLGLTDNVFGDALAVYRTDVLRTLGGWNAGSEAMWEDWELFVRMTAAGHQIWVIPRELFLYREHPGAMSRTYNRFWGSLRMAAAFPNLPRSEAISLTRTLMSLSKIS